jgi:hypothetical protein
VKGIGRVRVSLVIVVLGVTAACAPSIASRSGSAAGPPAAEQQAMKLAVATTTAKVAPRQLRAQFEQLLGLHALLAVRLMRSVVSAVPDFQQVANAALQDNTDALSRLVASAYGGAQADRFKQLWQRHIADLFRYANGVVNRDASATQTARTALLAYCDAHGAWLAAASSGRVRASDAADGVRMHVEELMKQLDAFAAGDYDQAYRIEREAYEHMFTAGVAVAKGSVTPELAVGLDTPPEKLRSAFTMLLGEHMELIVDAQRATFAGAPQFNAAAAQVNANTSALTKGVGAIVGAREATEFQSLWARHVEGLMAYTAAVAGKNEAGKAAAKQQLDNATVNMAAYFSGIVHQPRAFIPLTDALTMHDRHLIDHVDAYAARDYDRAQQLELEGYRQMLGVANTLVSAIQRTINPQLPVGGSQTGGGGAAHSPHEVSHG